MTRLTRIVLVVATLNSLAACTNSTHSAPAATTRPVPADVAASADEMVALDDMLRDACERLIASIEEPWRAKLGVALEELAA